MHDGEKDDAKIPVEQSFMRSWDCSQIEDEEESWRGRDHMAAQRDEERTLEEILEQRRLEGSSLQLEVVRKVPGLVVHERMSQGKGVKGFKEKKNVSGWSVEEVKEKPNVAVEEDTEEMRNWRGLSKFAILLDLRVTKVVQLLSDTERVRER